MKRLFITLALTLVPAWALSQEASDREADTVTEIARCMAEGLPEGWQRAFMLVELAEPGAASGGVKYLASRSETADDAVEFTPCSVRRPAELLLQLRDSQPPERRAWRSARLMLLRDGNFRLNYDAPN
jgi:hypothetical protein